MLKGKKTYIVSILAAAVVAATPLGYIPPDLANTILGFLGAAGLATLRAGVSDAS